MTVSFCALRAREKVSALVFPRVCIDLQVLDVLSTVVFLRRGYNLDRFGKWNIPRRSNEQSAYHKKNYSRGHKVPAH